MDVIFAEKIPCGKFQGRWITEEGNILQTNSKKFLTPRMNSGLLKVEGKNSTGRFSEYVHVLMIQTFFENYKDGVILHKDGNLLNNHKDNLCWRDKTDDKVISNFSNYTISKKGTVTSYCNIHAPQMLSPFKNENGYILVGLTSDDGKQLKMLVHRLVALTYLPNPKNLPEVDHIDRKRDNNNLENLRWVNKFEQAANKKQHDPSKAVLQYSKDGLFLGEYRSAEDAIRLLDLNVVPWSIRRNALKNRNVLKFVTNSYIWKFKEYKDLYSLQEGEEAVPVVGKFPGVVLNYPEYLITNFGNIIRRGRKLSTTGIYPACKLAGTFFHVHKLVALFFVSGRTKINKEIDHLDQNKKNARFDNLEWVSHSENVKRFHLKRV